MSPREDPEIFGDFAEAAARLDREMRRAWNASRVLRHAIERKSDLRTPRDVRAHLDTATALLERLEALATEAEDAQP